MVVEVLFMDRCWTHPGWDLRSAPRRKAPGPKRALMRSRVALRLRSRVLSRVRFGPSSKRACCTGSGGSDRRSTDPSDAPACGANRRSHTATRAWSCSRDRRRKSATVAGLAADDYRPAAQRRVIALLDGGVEGIHIQVHDPAVIPGAHGRWARQGKTAPRVARGPHCPGPAAPRLLSALFGYCPEVAEPAMVRRSFAAGAQRFGSTRGLAAIHHGCWRGGDMTAVASPYRNPPAPV
jgi:hypothetical protein